MVCDMILGADGALPAVVDYKLLIFTDLMVKVLHFLKNANIFKFFIGEIVKIVKLIIDIVLVVESILIL